MFKGRKNVLLLLAGCFALSMFVFLYRFWAPPKDMHYDDLYARWYPTRELLLHGKDPYGPAVTAGIQEWFYGRPLDPRYRGYQPADENRFAYPLYIVFLLSPTVTLSFAQVQTLFYWVLPLVVLATILLWLSAVGWRCDKRLLVSVVVLSFANFPVLENLYMQQPALLAAAFLAGSFAALSAGRLRLSGALLAFATIKPQLCFLLVPWLLLWSFSDWRVRKNLALSFGATMAALLAASEVLLPGWIVQFVNGLIAYRHYTGNFSILVLLFTRTGSIIATAVLMAGLVFVVWRTRPAPAGSYRFNFTLSTVIVVTLVIAPTMYPTGQVLLLPVVYWILKDASSIWAEGFWTRLTYTGAWCLMGWPWIASVGFLLANLVIPTPRLQPEWMVALGTILLVPLSLLVFFAVRTRTVLWDRTYPLLEVAPPGSFEVSAKG